MSEPQGGEAELLNGQLKATSPSSSSTSVSSNAACEHEDSTRRRSIPVKLRETNQAGQYILKAEDAELLQEVLRDNLLLEKSDAPKKRPFLFRDLQFTSQRSAFDRQNPSFSSSQFHGFFTLFWLGVALMLVKVAANNFRAYGNPFGTTEIIELMLSRDVLVWQTAYLAGFIWWTYHRDWPWTHTVFMVLHCLTMLMKQHSYAAYNGYLSELYKKRDLLKTRLHRLEEHSIHDSVSSSYSSSTPSALVSEITNLRKQNKRRSLSEFKSIHATRDTDHLLSLSETIENGTALEPAQLVSLKGLLTKEIQLLSEGLQGQFSTQNQYPRNLNVGNFCEFITLPTLVYELEYPRTERIDWAYVAEKVVATFATIFVMIVVSQYWIYPVVMNTVEMKEQGLTVQQRLQEFPWVLSDLLFPFMMEYLLAFYVIWECVAPTATRRGEAE
ncbi:sterol O-acyltransferase 2 [Penicillium ochrochloron]